MQAKEYDTVLMTKSMYFSQNSAYISGSTLYGGLLDRCAVSQFAEVYKTYPHDYKDEGMGIGYFENVSVITNMSVLSSPVRVCLCVNSGHDCTYKTHIYVKKGETFAVSLVAIDQFGQPVIAVIQVILNFAESGIAEGQLARVIPAECTNLTFNVVSHHSSDTLQMVHARDAGMKVEIYSTLLIAVA